MPVYSITEARTIGQAPSAAPAQATDELPIRRGAGYGKLTVADIRAGLADAAALDGKADVGHTHSAAEVSDFNAASRGQAEAMVLAGTNLSISYAGAGATRTMTLAAVGGPGSYVALTSSRTAAASDNGRVLECDGSNRTLTLPAGLGKGFVCVVRRTAAGNATVARGGGVTFAPTNSDLTTAALWDEIVVECVADTGSTATFLVRLSEA